MPQKQLDTEYWKGKRIQEARESAMKNSIGLLDIAERLGLLKGRYKTLEELIIEYNGVVNQHVDNILQNINLEQTAQEPSGGHDESRPWDSQPITEGQRKAIYAITKADPELLGGTSFDDFIDNPPMSKQEASDFIDKHKKKTS